MQTNWLEKFHSIYIFKTGQCETFVEDPGQEVSLGDVVRTTALLRAINLNQKVHWYTSANARPLLQENHQLTAHIYDHYQFNPSENDLIINLEREVEVWNKIKYASNLVGFSFVNNQWLLKDLTHNYFTVNEWKAKCASEKITSWGACLMRLVGVEAKKTYGLYQKPNVTITSDIGLNWNVGNKWPSKATSEMLWKNIETNLVDKYKISWQRGLNSLDEYAEWIAANELIISLDSLGLHLAMAMEIPAIGLFGATDSTFFDASPLARFINFNSTDYGYDCMPCWKKNCFQKIHCSEHLSLHQLQNAVKSLKN